LNVAARVEQLAKTNGDAILLTKYTVEALPCEQLDLPTGDRTH
jgi:class 3 adenylate cyclase